MEKPWRGPKGSAELVLCQAVILGLSFRSAKEATFTAAFAEQKATKRLM